MVNKERFEFKTKASNLIRLKHKLKKGKICTSFVISVGEWEKSKLYYINEIRKKFNNKLIIIRSSAPNEDSINSSMAGAFDSIANVSVNDDNQIMKAIDKVINSYYKEGNSNIDNNEILIQPMIEMVVCSGVIFTRDLETLGPYYVINYDDETNNTDSITGGYGQAQKTLYIYKNTDLSKLNEKFRRLIGVVREIEAFTSNDKLDIEFAINVDKEIYILQVRPLALSKILLSKKLDCRVDNELLYIEKFLEGKYVRDFSVYGDTTIYGEMPDWNPAEIIGSHPTPLAFSLYRYLIMKSVWREARAFMGYYHPFPNELMVSIAGRPYVDVRNSFNSLIPSGVNQRLACKIVNFYLDKLAQNPQLHDKVEFEVVISCLTFNFDKKAEELYDAGFTRYEIDEFKKELFNLTNNLILDKSNVLRELFERVEKLKYRREKLLEIPIKIENIPMLVEKLLEDCIYYGTIPFSVFARCAFIGSSFLRALLDLEIISVDQYQNFSRSIDTVATEMLVALNKLKNKEITLETFIETYGHLRPGTYDITSYSYDERPYDYINIEEVNNDMMDYESIVSNKEMFKLNKKQRENIEELLEEFKFEFSVSDLFLFIKDSIQKREYIKFEFTKNISLALKLILRYGKYNGFNREELAYLHIEDILSYANKPFNSSSTQRLKDIIEKNKEENDLTAYIHLPDLIIDKNDIRIIHLQQRKPNFITSKKITAQYIHLDKKIDDLANLNFDDKIILIENADPGYDWIFTKKIVGLVTKYGGVASHMAIRCSEFGLPAAIGCGEKIYRKLINGEKIILNCKEKKVSAYEVSN